MKKLNTPKGFTLIEALVYLALFGLLIGGSVVAAYDVFESSGRGSTRAMLQEEGNFILAKISWALSGTKAITAPGIATLPCSSPASSFTVEKWDATVGTVQISQSGTNATITKGAGGAALPVNSSSVEVHNLTFKHCWNGNTSPDSVESKFTLKMRMPQGQVLTQDFSSTDYVRR